MQKYYWWNKITLNKDRIFELEFGRGKWGTLRIMQIKGQILFLFKILNFYHGCFHTNFAFLKYFLSWLLSFLVSSLNFAP